MVVNTANPNFTYGSNGQVPPMFSYPATIYLSFQYSTLYTSPTTGQTYFAQYGPNSFWYAQGNQCSGVLINRRAILTAANCIPTQFPFSPSGTYNDTIMIPITTNQFYPTLNSMLWVFIGVFETYQGYNNEISPSVPVLISNVVLVSCFI